MWESDCRQKYGGGRKCKSHTETARRCFRARKSAAGLLLRRKYYRFRQPRYRFAFRRFWYRPVLQSRQSLGQLWIRYANRNRVRWQRFFRSGGKGRYGGTYILGLARVWFRQMLFVRSRFFLFFLFSRLRNLHLFGKERYSFGVLRKWRIAVIAWFWAGTWAPCGKRRISPLLGTEYASRLRYVKHEQYVSPRTFETIGRYAFGCFGQCNER